MDIAVIVPCYNEEKSIISTIQSLTRELVVFDCSCTNLYSKAWCIYVYDNNSMDGTVDAVEEFLSSDEGRCFRGKVKIKRCSLQGKGYVIRQAFAELDASVYVMIDGDSTYDTKKLYFMINWALDKHLDMVTGDRLSSSYFAQNKRLFHNTGNRIVTNTVNLLFDSDYSDVLSGFRVFSRRFAKTFCMTGGGFTLETELSVHAAVHHLSTRDIVIDYRDRAADNPSKLRTLPDGTKILAKLFYLFAVYRPFLFYTTVGALFGIFGFLFLDSRWSAVLIGASLFSFFTGLLQENGQFRQRQNFECRLQDFTEKTD